MSRIGKNPVIIPEGVTATLEGTIITVKGKLGELTQEISSSISVEIKDGLELIINGEEFEFDKLKSILKVKKKVLIYRNCHKFIWI